MKKDRILRVPKTYLIEKWHAKHNTTKEQTTNKEKESERTIKNNKEQQRTMENNGEILHAPKKPTKRQKTFKVDPKTVEELQNGLNKGLDEAALTAPAVPESSSSNELRYLNLASIIQLKAWLEAMMALERDVKPLEAKEMKPVKWVENEDAIGNFACAIKLYCNPQHDQNLKHCTVKDAKEDQEHCMRSELATAYKNAIKISYVLAADRRGRDRGDLNNSFAGTFVGMDTCSLIHYKYLTLSWHNYATNLYELINGNCDLKPSSWGEEVLKKYEKLCYDIVMRKFNPATEQEMYDKLQKLQPVMDKVDEAFGENPFNI